MKVKSSNILKLLKAFCYKTPIRFYEMLLFTGRPNGFGLFSIILISNLITLSHLLVLTSVIGKGNLKMLISMSFIVGGILGVFGPLFYKDYDEILKEELNKGAAYNKKWRRITWGYIGFSILFIIVVVLLYDLSRMPMN